MSVPERVVVTGATGLLGQALVPQLVAAGAAVTRLTRRPGSVPSGPGITDAAWDPARGTIDTNALDGVDAVIHLAGEPVSERWTTAHKQAIRDSRVQGTRLLAESLARLGRRPSVLVSASAIGIYGDGGDRELTEQSPAGTDFLGTVAREWEAATAPAEQAGIRVAHARFGVILSPDGGALARLLPPFRMGGGGKIADGLQWMSWIARDDAVGAVTHLVTADAARGPVNIVAPNPVRNAEFSQVLAHVLHRPALVTVPAFALRLMFGEMADAVLLAGQRVSGARLAALGYACRWPTLDAALRHELREDAAAA